LQQEAIAKSGLEILKMMKTDKCRLFVPVFLSFLLCLCVSSATGGEGFSPSWSKGDRWLVEAVYQSVSDREAWSAPVYWEYRVVGFEDLGPEKYLVLQVKDYNGNLRLETRLMYRASDLSLARVEIKKMRRGKSVSRVLTWERGGPVRTEQTLSPFDTPVFPLILTSSTDFTIKKSVGTGLKATRTVRQEVRCLSGSKDLSGDAFKKGLIEVKCTGDDGEILFVQSWDKDLPWPVSGMNGHMKYRLVKNW